MSSLSTRTKKISGFIDFKGYDSKALFDKAHALSDYLSSVCDIYALICHNKDLTPEGVPKTPHIHFVGDLKAAARLSTTLNSIATNLQCDPFAVTISKYTSFEGCIQYLIHKNNPDKAQYDRKDIITNIGGDDLGNYLDNTTVGFDLESWISIIYTAPNIVEVIRAIGPTYYNMYRNVICDIFRNFHEGNLYGQFKPVWDTNEEF